MTLRIAALCLVAASLAACGGDGRETRVFVVDVASGERRQLAVGERFSASPSWSPDGTRLSVVASGTETSAIEVVSREGGVTASVVEVPGTIHGAAWSPRVDTVAYVRVVNETRWTLEAVGANGSGRRTLATHESGGSAPGGPSWSPGGEAIAHTAGADTYVVPTAGGALLRTLPESWLPSWSPDGRSVVVLRGHELVAVPVAGGPPRTVAEGALDARPSWSPVSDVVAFSGVTFGSDRRYHLYLAHVGSGAFRALADDAVATPPSWSPDGRRLAYATWDGSVHVLEPETGETRTLARVHDTEVRDLAWSPDGERIAFVARPVPED